jgi:hypothetical protein
LVVGGESENEWDDFSEFVGGLEFGLNGIFLGLNGIDFLGFFRIYRNISFVDYTFGYIVIRMDERILRISPILTDFFRIYARNPSKKTKKICTNP